MKKILASLLAVCMILSLSVCLSSCDWFEEEESTTIEILNTPSEKDFLSLLNNGISAVIAEKPGITYKSSVEIGGIEAKHPEGSTSTYDLGTFDSAADYVKKLIMKDKPFNVNSVDISKGTALIDGLVVDQKTFDNTDIYLNEIASADFFGINDDEATVRNWANENATDAEGKTITNGDGEVETVTYLADNNLLVNIKFNDVIEKKDENGKVTETTAIAPDAAVIEKYFGKPADVAGVTAELNKTSAYLLFGDYTYEYSDCTVDAVIDLATGNILSMTFTKSMNITLPVKGVGTFEAIGDAVLLMRATETSSFVFNYTSESESVETTLKDSETTLAAPTDDATTEATEQTTAVETESSTADETTTAAAASTTAAA